MTHIWLPPQTIVYLHNIKLRDNSALQKYQHTFDLIIKKSICTLIVQAHNDELFNGMEFTSQQYLQKRKLYHHTGV